MKAIQFNKVINLKNGLTIPTGALIVMGENYFNVSNILNGLIPSQFGLQTYVNAAAYAAGKEAVNPNSITEFTPLVSTAVSLADYTAKGADNIAAQAVKQALIDQGTGAGKIDIIDILI